MRRILCFILCHRWEFFTAEWTENGMACEQDGCRCLRCGREELDAESFRAFGPVPEGTRIANIDLPVE